MCPFIHSFIHKGPSPSPSSSSSSSSSDDEGSDDDAEVAAAPTPPRVVILSEKEMNELAAKIIRAELMGDEVGSN